MSFLVTGGCGFIASNFLKKYVPLHPEWKFVNLDKMNYCSTRNNVSNLERLENYTFICGDVGNAELIDHIFEVHGITHVVHFAAQSHVCRSFAGAGVFVRDNINATCTLLDTCVKYKSQLVRFIHVSTDEVVGDNTSEYVHEDVALHPTNPYAGSKAACEMMCRSYQASYRLPIIVTRGNNVYGPQQFPEKVIPSFIMRLRRGMEMKIHGQGLTRRTFMYVDDVVDAFVCVLEKGDIGEVYNISSRESNEKSVIELAHMIHAVCGRPKPFEECVLYSDDRPYNDKHYRIRGDKLRGLGWEEKYDIERGLRETYEWYKDHGETHWGAVDL